MARISSMMRAVLLAACIVAPASATPFEATLSMRFGPLGTVSFTGSGSGTSTRDAVFLSGSVFSGTGMAAATAPFARMTAFTANLEGDHAGIFRRTRFFTGLHGAMRLDGSLLVKGTVFGNSLTILGFPLYTTHGWGSTPDFGGGVGVGPVLRFSTSNGSRYLALDPDIWRTSKASVPWVTKMVTYHLPTGMAASMVIESTYSTHLWYTGEDARTPGGLGQITLVSPTAVTMNITGQYTRFAMLSTLTVEFTPEPRTALLVGSGAALLGALRRRHRKTSSDVCR